MKVIIATLTFVLLVAGPTYAASPSPWQLHEGRAGTFVPYSGGYSVGTDYSTTNREAIAPAARPGGDR
jgi:hypothetical protein